MSLKVWNIQYLWLNKVSLTDFFFMKKGEIQIQNEKKKCLLFLRKSSDDSDMWKTLPFAYKTENVAILSSLLNLK